MMTKLPWGVQFVLGDIVDVMVPENQNKPGQLEVRVIVSLDWANHGTKDHEIRQWPVEFQYDGLPATTVAELVQPIVARPANAGIFTHEKNVSLIMWFEQAPSLPDEITRELLTEARMVLQRQPRQHYEDHGNGPIGVIPHLEALELDVERRVRARLAREELFHAEQMLEMKGSHEEAMLRAAGVIAGIVLERHFSDIVDKVNAKLSPAKPYTHSKNDGISSYANFLIGEGLIEPTERTPLEGLAFIRNCCDHPPGGNLRVPMRDEVTRLIQGARQYTVEIQMP